MIHCDELYKQLEKIDFNPHGWGRSEVGELCNILEADEVVEQCVNGTYEAGFALLVATKHRVLLIDKKPLNYLTVEELRFDMINEFDYSHRLFGAHACISSGSKTLNFTSWDQKRLRALVTYVQGRMTEIKKTMHTQQEAQQQHLEAMNQRLEEYLLRAHELYSQQRQLAAWPPAQYTPPTLPQSGMATLPTVAPSPTSVTSAASFERAAAASVGAPPTGRDGDDTPMNDSRAAIPGDGLANQAFTPQQIGVAAIRRVIPIVTAYAGIPLHRPMATRAS